ncbi:MAG: hypothetical protein JJE25_09135 [Bacteroidia bacterium]|nr:hypothetical protein [Bacteroidia bacterium]
MKKFNFYFTFFLVSMLILGSCEKDYLAPVKKVEITGPVSFATDIIPIITSNCANAATCHVQGGHSPNLNTSNAFDGLATFVDPSNPMDSRLYKQITWASSPVMPPTAPAKLTPEQIGYILAWIEQGAQNN